MKLIKIKNICTSKDTIKKWKDNLQNGRKYLHIIYLVMPGFRIICKELIQLNNKKAGTPSKKRAKHFSSDFSKDKHPTRV